MHAISGNLACPCGVGNWEAGHSHTERRVSRDWKSKGAQLLPATKPQTPGHRTGKRITV